MGYGKVLKEILDEKQMSVKTLSRNTGVPAPTIYSIIRRDTPYAMILLCALPIH